MAAGAGDFVVVVATAVPARADIAFVAAETHRVLHADGSFRVSAEADDRWTFLPAAYAAGVFATWSVAGFTLQLSAAERAARIGWHTMRCFEHRHR